MIRTPRPAGRPGVTLTEVLVAMFVMAIGMISLLTLFPLGAMQVGQALRDDRATQLARQADAYLRQTWRTEVVTNNGNNEGYFWAMDDPYLVVKYPNPAVNGTGFVMRFVGQGVSSGSWYDNAALTTVGTPAFGTIAGSMPTSYTLTRDRVSTTAPAPVVSGKETYVQLTGTTTDGASYPVMIDPTFVNAIPSSVPERAWVGVRVPPSPSTLTAHPNALRIPRRSCQLVNPVNTPFTAGVSAFELTSLIDDMAFNANGAPVGGSELGRQGRYSWSAVVQRPRNDDRFLANLSVLVYDKRPALPQAGDELVVVPDAPGAAKDSRTVRITLPNRTGDTSPVLLKRGGWLIDGTVDSVTPFRRNFFAYRVAGLTEVTVGATTTVYDVDLETPLKADLTPDVGVGGLPASQLYLFAGLIEVYTRPQLRPDSPY